MENYFKVPFKWIDLYKRNFQISIDGFSNEQQDTKEFLLKLLNDKKLYNIKNVLEKLYEIFYGKTEQQINALKEDLSKRFVGLDCSEDTIEKCKNLIYDNLSSQMKENFINLSKVLDDLKGISNPLLNVSMDLEVKNFSDHEVSVIILTYPKGKCSDNKVCLESLNIYLKFSCLINPSTTELGFAKRHYNMFSMQGRCL